MDCKDCLHHDTCIFTDDVPLHGEDVSKSCGCFADKSRYIELPCKVGEIAYKIEYEHDCTNNSECYFGDCAECGFAKHYQVVKEIKMYTLNHIFHWFDCFGKIIFATKEEAEKSLKERERK